MEFEPYTTFAKRTTTVPLWGIVSGPTKNKNTFLLHELTKALQHTRIQKVYWFGQFQKEFKDFLPGVNYLNAYVRPELLEPIIEEQIALTNCGQPISSILIVIDQPLERKNTAFIKSLLLLESLIQARISLKIHLLISCSSSSQVESLILKENVNFIACSSSKDPLVDKRLPEFYSRQKKQIMDFTSSSSSSLFKNKKEYLILFCQPRSITYLEDYEVFHYEISSKEEEKEEEKEVNIDSTPFFSPSLSLCSATPTLNLLPYLKEKEKKEKDTTPLVGILQIGIKSLPVHIMKSSTSNKEQKIERYFVEVIQNSPLPTTTTSKKEEDNKSQGGEEIEEWVVC